jgi:hypothetical protein
LSRRQIVHEFKGRFEVCKRVSGQTGCKALVDEDPNSIQPPYLARINLVEELRQQGLKVFQDESRGNLVVVMCPKLEDWILKAAEETGLKVSSYSLPDSSRSLHRVINADIRKLERLLQDLINEGSERVRTLKRMLN